MQNSILRMITRTTNSNGSRFYEKDKIKYPSVTTILNYYPKGIGFYKWLMRVGFQADIIRDTAGDKGTKVHNAVEELLKNKKYSKKELSLEEIDYIEQFKKWFDSIKTKKMLQ